MYSIRRRITRAKLIIQTLILLIKIRENRQAAQKIRLIFIHNDSTFFGGQKFFKGSLNFGMLHYTEYSVLYSLTKK